MAVNIYLMPAVVRPDGTPHAGARSPKYWAELASASVRYASIDYGDEPVFLVVVNDIPGALHTTIAADSVCVTVPDLQQSVGGQVAQVQSVLDALNIPANWVGAGMSYGSVVRVVAIVFQLAQRLQGQGAGRLFSGTVTLGTRFNQLPSGVRTQLLTMAQSFNFDTTGMSGATTIRTILKALADQWPNLSIQVGDLVL